MSSSKQVSGNSAKEKEWRQILQRKDASGLSVRAFCRQEGIRESSYYFWRQTIRDRDAQPQATARDAFVPAAISELPFTQQGDRIVLELRTGFTLHLPATTSATWVAELITVLDARGQG